MLLVALNAMGGAFQDVVADGLMVVSARKDPTAGSEELQSLSWMMYGVGGIIACTVSGVFLSGEDCSVDPNNCTPTGNPYISFLVMTFFGCAIGITGFFINKDLE